MSQVFTLLLWAWLMASSFVVSGFIVEYASPIATSAFRFLLACLIMLLVLLVSWRKKKLTIKNQLTLLFSNRVRCFHYGVISGSLVAFFIGFFVALQSTTPLNTSVLYTLVPLMGVFIARVWLREVLPWLRVVGFSMGSIGAILVLFSTQGGVGFEWHSGDVVFVGACFSLALHVVSVQKWGRSLDALSGAFIIMLFGNVWLLPIALLWGDLSEVKWYTSGFWLYGLYLTIFTTLFTFLLQQRLVITVGSSRLLAFSYTIPVWVALFVAIANNRLSNLLDWGFMSGLLCLCIALLLIDGSFSMMRKINGSQTATK
ncbi:DMT family transporter [Marinomonas sp.]|nr:DMT family transporter [Marinomonas sp.]MDB4837315.1 DMT family transporter [Marinomonas sp.]